MTVEELKVIISAETNGFDKASKNTKKTITKIDKTINSLHKKLQSAFNIRENNNNTLNKLSSQFERMQKTAQGVNGAVGAIRGNLGNIGKTSISGVATDLANARKQAEEFEKEIKDIWSMDANNPEYDKKAHEFFAKYKGFFQEQIATFNLLKGPQIDYEKLYKWVNDYTPEKDLEKSKRLVSDIQQEMKKIKLEDTGIKKMIKELTALEKKLEAVNKQRQKLLEPISNFMDVSKADPEVLRDAIPRLADVDSQISDYQDKISKLREKAIGKGWFDKKGRNFNTDALGKQLQMNEETLQTSSQTIDTTKKKIKDLESYLKKTSSQAKKATKSVSKFGRALKMIKMSAGFMILGKIFGAITKSVSECYTALLKFDKAKGNILGYNTAMSNLNSSFKKLGGEISIVIAQIIQAIEGALSKVISLVNAIIIQFSRLFAIFTGKKQIAIVKDGYWKDYTDDVKGATAAQKKFVASFDELNIITKNSSGGAGSSDNNLSEELFDIEDVVPTKFEKRLKDIFDKWKKTIPKLEFKFDKKKAIADVKDIIANIANVIGGVGSFVISIGIKVANDLNLGQLLNDVLGLINSFTYLASCIVEALIPAFTAFYDYGISPIVQVFGEILSEVIKTFSGWFRSLGDLFIELTPVFEAIGKALGKIIGFLGATVGYIVLAAWKIFAATLGLIGKALKKILENKVVQALLVGIGTALGVIGGAALIANGALAAFAGIMKVVSGAIGLAKGAMALFNAVLAANPIVLVVAAIAGLVAAFIYLWNNCEGFREFWIKLWDKIKLVASNAAGKIKEVFEDVKTALKNLKDKFSNIFDQIKNNVSRVVNTIRDKISGAINKVKELFGFSNKEVTVTTKTKGGNPKGGRGKPQPRPFASGGVVKTPTLGLVGEYQGARSNPEIIAPQSVITDIIDSRNDEMISVITQLFRQTISAIENQDMSISIGDETIARSAARGNKANKYRTGKSLF